MKKFLVLLFILLCSLTCKDKIEQSSYNVFEHSYAIESESISSLYKQLDKYGQDSIPLDKWPAFMGTNDDGFILQQMLSKYSDSTVYIFIYNVHYVDNDSIFYSVRVRKINKK